ncbi:hypothetical protein [Clostridium paridis]|uniref:DUF485 domain-containing protein n=1 Tax=Clostridium paridis TaxID=2803863 RepID=A0A937FH31_9CLOT|nr:hypothetical protein [Clostridium paridis]MBL4933259.1 hypothetical protein [Clostridium paridis]
MTDKANKINKIITSIVLFLGTYFLIRFVSFLIASDSSSTNDSFIIAALTGVCLIGSIIVTCTYLILSKLDEIDKKDHF